MFWCVLVQQQLGNHKKVVTKRRLKKAEGFARNTLCYDRATLLGPNQHACTYHSTPRHRTISRAGELARGKLQFPGPSKQAPGRQQKYYNEAAVGRAVPTEDGLSYDMVYHMPRLS